MLIHTGQKPKKCNYCDAAYRQAADLNRHLQLHLGVNIYKCDKCSQCFRLKTELRKHSYEHYQQEKLASNNTDIVATTSIN